MSLLLVLLLLTIPPAQPATVRVTVRLLDVRSEKGGDAARRTPPGAGHGVSGAVTLDESGRDGRSLPRRYCPSRPLPVP